MKIIKEAIPYVIILVVVLVIRSFIATPVIVSGSSMEPTLDKNQVLLLKKYDHSYERFDIIVFNYNDSKLVKRIIGLPGETVEYKDGSLYINGNIIEDQFASITYDYKYFDVIPDGYYFVLGDNRKASSDSRMIGLVSKEDIVGISTFSLWPIKTIK